MSTSGQTQRKAPAKGRASRARRQGRGPASRQPTKAELQAIEARRRATILTEDVAIVEEEPVRPRRQVSERRVERQRQAPVRAFLTKAQEYAYIRSDLRRLVVTAGPLLLLMIVLLFVLER